MDNIVADEKNLFVELEHEVMELWDKEKFYEKLVEKNKGKKMFRFLDGPITANNPMGIHHAWGRSTKDTFIRWDSDSPYMTGGLSLDTKKGKLLKASPDYDMI